MSVSSRIGSEVLLGWYAANRRVLPWRSPKPDPYAVWVSEIMLQQTTVAAVVPFYERWMTRFPTLAALAEAPIDDVLKAWAGLGYYARARNLHAGARHVTQQCGGLVPSEVNDLIALPGIGRYTAGAIASIAFDRRVPILDANVIRVLARFHAVDGDPKSAAALHRLWSLAEQDIPAERPGDFNQALMELGALICAPASPQCGKCPIACACAANRSGDPTRYPEFARHKKWLEVDDVSVAVRNGSGSVLIVQRSEQDRLWGGLWELPRATRQAGESDLLCAARAVETSVGLTVSDIRPFAVHNHVVANRRITLHGYEAQAEPNATPFAKNCARFAWEAPANLRLYALPSPQVRLIELLAEFERQPRLSL